MGFDHPQWEMYSASKHGVRALLKQSGVLPESAAAPTCQTCHMVEGNHEVRAPWGFLAVRLPLPEDEQWKADQVTILQGLGVLDPEGNPTARLDVVKAADVARLDQESWQKGRDQMIGVCSECHSETFAKASCQSTWKRSSGLCFGFQTSSSWASAPTSPVEAACHPTAETWPSSQPSPIPSTPLSDPS